ncbi:hypothetical protein MBLNU230_g4513t1 [Neophaeotheca triangularis]
MTGLQEFRAWAQHHGIEITGALEEMRGSILGIDAEEFLNSLLTTSLTREPLLPALGGLPFALESHLEIFVHNCRDAGIKPFFIFNGIDTAVRDRATVSKECKQAARSLDEAWKQYDATKADDAVAEFGKSCTYQTYNILRWMQGYLYRAGVKIMVAPYSAAAQLHQREVEDFITGVWGSASALVFGQDKVIVDMDFENKSFSWIETANCMEKLGCTSKIQFTDACLLAGFCLLPILPAIEHEEFKLDAAMELMRRSNPNRTEFDGFFACLAVNDDHYTGLFKKARFAIKHHIVLYPDGHFRMFDEANAPHDIHECIGQRIPEEFLFYLTRGIAGPRIINWRTKQEVFEVPPLDGGISQAYKNLVQQKLLPMRAQALALGTSSLHFYFQKTDINAVMWFDEDTKKSLDIPGISEPTKASDSWHVNTSKTFTKADHDKVGSKAWMVEHNDVDYYLQILGEPDSMAVALSLLAIDDETAKKTVTPRQPGEPVLTTLNELSMNTIWRFLHDRGYMKADHTLSAWGRALKAAFDRNNSKEATSIADLIGSKELQEAIFVAFELARLDILKADNLFPEYSGAPLRGTDIDKQYTLLVSRVASLASLQHHAIGYTGPLSRHLLAYHQMTCAVRNALRDILDMHACRMFLSGGVKRHLGIKTYPALAYILPLGKEPDLGLGLAVKSYLDELSTQTNRPANVSQWFPHSIDFSGDLQKAWKLFDAVNFGLQAAAKAGLVKKDVGELFEGANTWLHAKLKAAPPDSGYVS